MDENGNKGLIKKIKELLERLKKAIEKRKQERKDGKLTPAVFERELKTLEKKLEQVEEQDDIHTDALRDVAATLEKITGSIENGELRNATAEEIKENLTIVGNKIAAMAAKGSEPYTVTSQTLDDVLQRAFGKKQEDLYVVTEDGQKMLSPSVKIAFDKQDGKKADVYLILDEKGSNPLGAKIKVNKKGDFEKITFEKVAFGHSGETYRTIGMPEKNFELMPLDALRSRPLQEIIGEALFQSSEEYLKARIEKGYNMANEWKSISGTKDNPYTRDEFQCIHDDAGRYCIKDRLHDTMIAFSYDKKEKSFIATFYSDAKNGFDVNGDEGSVVMKVWKQPQPNGKSKLGYTIATSPNADIILDTEMAQKALRMIIPDKETRTEMNNVRHGNKNLRWDKTGGELVIDANREKIIELRNEIEKQLRSQKGLDGYFVSFRSTRHGKETQLVISAPNKADREKGKSEYIINFDKKGNIKSHLWSSYDISKGERNKPAPVVSTSKNFVNKVLDKEGFSKKDLCVCFQVVKESLQAVDEKLKGQGMQGFSQDLTTSQATNMILQDSVLLQEWVRLAKDAIIENNMRGELGERKLINMILEEAERRDGVYPNAEYKEALIRNVDDLYFALAENGVIETSLSDTKKITHMYEGKEEDVQHFEATGYASDKARDEAAKNYMQMTEMSEYEPPEYENMSRYEDIPQEDYETAMREWNEEDRLHRAEREQEEAEYIATYGADDLPIAPSPELAPIPTADSALMPHGGKQEKINNSKTTKPKSVEMGD